MILNYVIIGPDEQCISAENLFDKLLLAINGIDCDVKKYLGLQYFEIEAISYTGDRYFISKNEFVDKLDIRFEYTPLLVEFEIKVRYNVKCLKDLCYAV